jgi:hypothetical protein
VPFFPADGVLPEAADFDTNKTDWRISRSAGIYDGYQGGYPPRRSRAAGLLVRSGPSRSGQGARMPALDHVFGGSISEVYERSLVPLIFDLMG